MFQHLKKINIGFFGYFGYYRQIYISKRSLVIYPLTVVSPHVIVQLTYLCSNTESLKFLFVFVNSNRKFKMYFHSLDQVFFRLKCKQLQS